MSGWPLVAEITGVFIALLSLGWTITRDWRSARHTGRREAAKREADYINSTLAAFQGLTESLRSEIQRLQEEREAFGRAFHIREQRLLAEIARLRLELKIISQCLERNGIPTPVLDARSVSELYPHLVQRPGGTDGQDGIDR